MEILDHQGLVVCQAHQDRMGSQGREAVVVLMEVEESQGKLDQRVTEGLMDSLVSQEIKGTGVKLERKV